MNLDEPMADGAVSLEPLAEAHREGLRTACAKDEAVWDIYMLSMLGPHFDGNFDTKLAAHNVVTFAVLVDGAVVGMSSYVVNTAARSVEIGSTYIAPEVRGTSVNRTMKDLMIRRAFAWGANRIQFTVDTRNARSMAAMAKLRATREGTLRNHLVTWTGYVRDSAVYSILPGEWEMPA